MLEKVYWKKNSMSLAPSIIDSLTIKVAVGPRRKKGIKTESITLKTPKGKKTERKERKKKRKMKSMKLKRKRKKEMKI